MKLYFTISYFVFVLAIVANAVTLSITDRAVQGYQATAHYQKLFQSGFHPRPSSRQIPAKSAIGMAELLKLVESAQKAAEKRRRIEKMFKRMIQITNEYKN